MALIINGVKVAGIGADGKDGVGVVAGGAVGQVLTKKTELDYDTEWTDQLSVDETLSVEGAAADAKVVGERLGNLDTLVGTTSVADQISAAVIDLEFITVEDIDTICGAEIQVASSEVTF